MPPLTWRRTRGRRDSDPQRCRRACAAGGKVVAWRSGRCVESVLFKTHRGATRARVYDKGLEAGVALPRKADSPRGAVPLSESKPARCRRTDKHVCARAIPPQARSALGRRARRQGRRADRACRASPGGDAPRRLSASRARTIVGYLVLAAADVPQGARRTRYDLERDARRLGLGVTSTTEQRPWTWARSSRSALTRTHGWDGESALGHPVQWASCGCADCCRGATQATRRGSRLLLVRLVPGAVGGEWAGDGPAWTLSGRPTTTTTAGERGGRYVGVAATHAERTQRQGDEFPGLP